MASKRNGTLYMGATSNLPDRIQQHKSDAIEGFTKRYGAHQFVWYEYHESMNSVIAREKAMKEWNRKWKLELIESVNPDWQDLAGTII